MEKIVIIGAGPAGLLLAHYLLARGNYAIEIYERRPDPRLETKSSERSFPVVLQARGLSGLRGVNDLEETIGAEGIWSHGSVLHGKKKEPRVIERKTASLIINRDRLTQKLITELLASPKADQVTLKFDCPCIEVNLTAQTVTLNSQTDGEFMVKFDRLVGADGAASQVRESLKDQHYLDATKEIVSDVYKSFSVSRISPDGSMECDGSKVHAWTMSKGVRLVMAPQQGDRLNGTLIFPPDANPIEDSQSGEDVLAYFAEAAPSLTKLMSLEDAEYLRQARISTLTTVKCDHLHVEDKVVLIGDAAHAVSPSIGQGCNSSLQDAAIFDGILSEHNDDWSQALPAFTEQRLADVHALRDLSDYAFPRSKKMTAEFIFRMTLGRKLRKYLPNMFTPLPMELVMETDRNYAEILQQCQRWVDNVRNSIPAKAN